MSEKDRWAKNTLGLWIHDPDHRPLVLPGCRDPLPNEDCLADPELAKGTVDFIELIYGPVPGSKQIMCKSRGRNFPEFSAIARERYAAIAKVGNQIFGHFFPELSDQWRRNTKID